MDYRQLQMMQQMMKKDPFGGDFTMRPTPNPQYVTAPGQETFNPNSLNADGTPNFAGLASDFSTPVQDAALSAGAPSNMGGYAAAVGLLGNMMSSQADQKPAPMMPLPQNNQPQGPQRIADAYAPYMAQGLLNRRRSQYGA